MRFPHALGLPLLAIAFHASAALADPAVVTPPYDPNWYVAAGADWTQATIKSSDGTTLLHADILRPHGDTDANKTPVVLSIGPYFNHSGQTGPAGPAENSSYTPVGTDGVGPSDRFADFVVGSHLMAKGYTFVMVDLRGFGSSTGCPDWGGPGEQGDVADAVKWAASQPWSTGKVGTYGKSYDAETGLIADALHPPGLAAVVSQEPVYDDYRYLYGDGMRRENALATPALYDAIATTPGPLADTTSYNTASVTTPNCSATNYAAQANNDDHTSDYWKARNLINEVKGSAVPLFLTQGLTENNTAPDGTQQFLDNHDGFERGWMGPWEHVRGNETCQDGDSSTGCTSTNVGKLKEGRAGWFDEVMRFYDLFLKGQAPTVSDPPFAIQTNDGKWRGEASWPPADASNYTTPLNKGSYVDTAQSAGTDFGTASGGTPAQQPDPAAGAWTISPVLDHEVDLSGSPTITVNVTTTGSNDNLVADIYDLDKTGVGPLVSRQGFLVRTAGTQNVTLQMESADWRFAAGRRIGIRITDNNQEWWTFAAPTGNTVTVNGGSAVLPFLKFQRPTTIQGDPGIQLATYLSETENAGSQLPAAQSAAFSLPPALVPPQPGDPGTQEAIDAANKKALAMADQQSAVLATGSGLSTAAIKKVTKSARHFVVHIVRGKPHRVVATGTAPAHAKVTILLIRNAHLVSTHHVRADAKGHFRTTFTKVRHGWYHLRARSAFGKVKLHARTRPLGIH